MRPAVSHTKSEYVLGNSRALGPDDQGKRFAAHGHHDRIAAVSGLLFTGGPACVGQGVAGIVVDSVQSKFWGPTVDVVVVEPLEVQPLVADRNAAPAVPAEELMGLIKAPIPHAAPPPVERMFSEAVGYVRSGVSFLGEAAAGFGPASAKNVTEDDLFASTRAAAKPIQGTVVRLSDNGPAAELKSGEIHLLHADNLTPANMVSQHG